MHSSSWRRHVVGPNETAEAEWIEQKHRRKAKRAELLKTGAIIKTMPKPMVETITSQNLQLDYAALPFEERQQLEREKEDAKQHWLHTDSLAFKFWGATENYLGLETLTLDGQQTTEDGESSRSPLRTGQIDPASTLHPHMLAASYCPLIVNMTIVIMSSRGKPQRFTSTMLPCCR